MGGRGRRDFECKFYLVATLHVMQFAEFMHAGNNIVGGLAFLSEYRRGQPPPPLRILGGGGGGGGGSGPPGPPIPTPLFGIAKQ